MYADSFGKEINTYFWLDPRTKIFLLLCINLILTGGGFSGVAGLLRPLLASIPFVLLIVERKIKPALLYLVFVTLALVGEIFFVKQTDGILNLAIVVFSGLISRLVPVLVMGYYVVSTTKISEFVAAMERMYFPQKIIIPFSVMLRFFPTVAEENAAISDAMKMRGIRLGGKNAGAMLEYRIIPLLMSTVKIGEELSAAALTRGLGKPVKRTNICQIGFAAKDILFMLVGAIAMIVWFVF